MLSVIMPIYNEEKYIGKCLDSILEQDYPKDDLEILLVDGMSKDRTREIIANYMQKFPYIKLLNNPQQIAPCAMNIGIKASHGEVIIRLDAHVFYEKKYISTLVKCLNLYNADNVGAICKTDVLNKNPKTLAIREVLSNKFGVGNSNFRIGIKEAKEVDTVPFGCWKREVFDKYGNFDTRLVRNQDIELNKRIINGGGKIILTPETSCTYFARETFKALSKNNFSNGKWNILTVFYTKNFHSLSLRHFIPLLFVLSLSIPLLTSLFWKPFIYISFLAFFLYFITLGIVCAKLSIQKNINFLYLLCGFITLHISYGWGSFVGILNLIFKKL